MDQATKTGLRKLRHSIYVLVPTFSCGMMTWALWGYLAARDERRLNALWALLYGAGFIGAIAATGTSADVGGAGLIALWVTGTLHALLYLPTHWRARGVIPGKAGRAKRAKELKPTETAVHDDASDVLIARLNATAARESALLGQPIVNAIANITGHSRLCLGTVAQRTGQLESLLDAASTTVKELLVSTKPSAHAEALTQLAILSSAAATLAEQSNAADEQNLEAQGIYIRDKWGKDGSGFSL